MCGHVGIAGKLEVMDEATIKRLLIYDFFRGMDSTGLAALRNNGEVKLAKAAVNPIDFFDMKKFQDTLSGYNSTVFIGHNRAATKGKVNNNNAHPFEYGHIVGAHNGTLDQSSWKALNELNGEETDVDSAAIFLAISKFGIEAVVPLLQGAWALVWFDTKDNTLNFLRNNQRPFWYSYTEDFKKVFWASEWPMIDAATKLSAQPYKLYTSDEGHRFWATKENWWYRFDLEELRNGATNRPKPRVKELKGKEPAPAANYACGTTPFKHGNYRGTTSTTTSRGTTSGSNVTQFPDVRNLVGSESNPLGGYMTETAFDALAKYGCSWCQADVYYGDPGVTIYEREEMVLCPDCSGNGNHSRIFVEPEKLNAAL